MNYLNVHEKRPMVALFCWLLLISTVLLLGCKQQVPALPTPVVNLPQLPTVVPTPYTPSEPTIPPTGEARQAAGPNCDYIITEEVEIIDGAEEYDTVQPGDRICIASGERSVLKIRNIQGEAGNPVIFINNGGVVLINAKGDDYAGVHFQNSEYIRLTGTGETYQCGANYTADEQKCGFVIEDAERGVVGSDRTGNIEIDHVETNPSAKMGIFIRTSATEEINRESWTQYNTYVHHNYIHDTGTEGFYIGGSSYTEGEEPVLIGVQVSYNLIVETGWDGLQVGSAVSDCTIHHNHIFDDSKEEESNQRSGIMNNPGSVCHIYNNFIVDSGSRGIYVQGNGGNRIYNNVIVRPGRRIASEGDGIVISQGSNEGESIFVWNNTIIEPKRDGIVFRNEQGDGNQIYNNLIVRKMPDPEDGIQYIDTKDLGNVTLANNLFIEKVEAARFTDPEANDFSLSSDSPAIDGGLDLTEAGLTSDYGHTDRPQGGAVDIGAFEYIP